MAAPCARLQFVREPVRNGDSVRPLNLIVRRHQMPRSMTTAAILVLIAGLAFGAIDRLQVRPKMRDADAYRTRPHAILDNAKNAVEIYKLEKGRYPTTQEGLNLLISGGYLKSMPLDRWGRPLNYRFPSTRSTSAQTGKTAAPVTIETSGIGTMTPNNTLERTVRHSGPRLSAAWSSWPAAQLDR